MNSANPHPNAQIKLDTFFNPTCPPRSQDTPQDVGSPAFNQHQMNPGFSYHEMHKAFGALAPFASSACPKLNQWGIFLQIITYGRRTIVE
jgi:hypothetical protein